MKTVYKRFLVAIMTMVLAFGLVGCSGSSAKKSPLDAKNPTNITIWNYYNGDQLAAFDSLVSEFNSTVGAEQGIVVDSVSQGTIDNLANCLVDSSNGKVGAQEMPTLAAVYPETAYILNKNDSLVNLDEYFTKDELSAYVPGFIEEGRLTTGGDLVLFPVSKSTECFAINETDWAPFEAATGISPDSIDSFESLTAAAARYYEYTDGLTPDVADDGKALYGRDSVANYLYVGAKQLNHELFEIGDNGAKVTLDRDTMKTLWDNYYIPFINGYFAANSSHRSEDMKTGSVLAVTSSTSGVSYLPYSVTGSDDTSHSIKISIKKPLNFASGSEVAVQQGAGYCVTKGTEQQQYAAVEFLKWFTDPDRNLDFSVNSGYSPVTTEANDADAIKTSFENNSKVSSKTAMLDALLVSSDVYKNEETYISKPFEGGKEDRNILEKALSDTCTTDRAAVVSAIQSGQTREQAVAPYSTDAYFDQWYNALVSSAEAVTK